MSNKLQSFSSKFLSLAFSVVLIFSLIITTFANVNVSTASIGIQPAERTEGDTQTEVWFIETIDAGSSVERKARVFNQSDEEVEFEIRAKDSVQTTQGGWTFAENNIEDKMVGSWIDLNQDKIKIGPNDSAEFSFKINVPEGTNPGEYGGVVAVQGVDKGEQTGSIKTVTRVGARVYITVPGDLKQGVEFNDFNIVTASHPASEPLKHATNLDPLALFVNLNFKNNGNLYIGIRGTLTLQTPSETLTKEYNSDDVLVGVPGVDRTLNFADENLEVGTYKGKFEFETHPIVNAHKDKDVEDSSPTKVVEFETQITQEILDELKQKREEYLEAKNNKGPENNSSNFEIESEAGIQEEKVEDADKNEINNTLVYVLIALIIILVAGFGGYVYKTQVYDKKQEKKDDKKSSKKAK